MWETSSLFECFETNYRHDKRRASRNKPHSRWDESSAWWKLDLPILNDDRIGIFQANQYKIVQIISWSIGNKRVT
jgi:hypothetical protein